MRKCKNCGIPYFSMQELKLAKHLLQTPYKPTTTLETSRYLNISIQAASNLMKKFYNQSLLSRRQLNRNAFRYYLTTKLRNIQL